MKNIAKRSLALLVLAAFCLTGLGILGFRFAVHGGEWATNRVNKHLYTDGAFSRGGTIYDIEGEALVSTEDGKRVYNSSKRVRRSLLHLLGDGEGFISNNIQSEYSDRLSGYSYINGLFDVVSTGNGHDMTLTVNSEVCAAAYDALNGRKGAVAAYNYKTGDVLCSVSSPNYDVRNKPENIDSDKSGKYDGIYINRVTSGLFVPGSIFKIITAACAEENLADIDSRSFSCDGSATVGETKVTCPKRHGSDMSFEDAFASSCNCVFAALAVELGSDKLTATAQRCGFNSSFECGRLSVTASRIDLTGCTDGELAWAGVGQYTTLVNPLSYLRVAGAVANGGVAVKPVFVFSGGHLTQSGSKEFFTAQVAARVKEMMRNNVSEVYGDSYFPKLDMCGKTGTAEIEQGDEPHAWFAGFSSNESCPVAIVVIVENGGYGSSAAVPVAAEVMKAAYDALV